MASATSDEQVLDEIIAYALGQQRDKIKNCYNCEHLEWISAESWDREGNVCNKREYKNDKEENMHLKQLENVEYLSKSKKCYEQKKEGMQ